MPSRLSRRAFLGALGGTSTAGVLGSGGRPRERLGHRKYATAAAGETPPPETQSAQTYGGSENDSAESVIETSDGGYLVAGWTESIGSGGVDAWLVKVDTEGTTQWEQTYGGSGDDSANSVIETSDGGFLFAGGKGSSGSGGGDAWLVKVDTGGTTQWEQTYGGSEIDSANSVIETSDGGSLVAGWTESSGSGLRDAWLVKVDTEGTTQWEQTYGGSVDDLANSVIETSDGGSLVAGWTGSSGGGDAWLVKVGGREATTSTRTDSAGVGGNGDIGDDGGSTLPGDGFPLGWLLVFAGGCLLVGIWGLAARRWRSTGGGPDPTAGPTTPDDSGGAPSPGLGGDPDSDARVTPSRGASADPEPAATSAKPDGSTRPTGDATVAGPDSGSPPETVPTTPDLTLVYDAIEKGGRLGTGATADVFEATVDTPEGELTIALKEPRFDADIDPAVIDGFEREADTWDRLDAHDNVVAVIDWGTEPHPWIAMEYMDGGPLNSVAGQISLRRAIWTLLEVIKGVYHAHQRGVAHLDLKPGNVLLRKTGATTWPVPKVADWGLSKVLLEHTHSIKGYTPLYAAPEQIAPKQFGSTDLQTDIYQLGAVGYTLVAGRPPFTGDASAVVYKILESDTPPPTDYAPDLPARLDEILLTALEKDRTDRYEAIVYLRDDLQELYDSL